MKQFAFLVVVTLLGGLGSLVHPFWGVLLYYGFAVLRPQHLWQWALPMEVRWSLLAAGVAGLGVLLNAHRVRVQQGFALMNQLMAIFGFTLLLSVLNAHFPAVAQEWAVEYAKILVMALLASLVIDRIWQVNLVALIVMACLGYIAWEVNLLYVLDGRLDIFHNGYGGLDNNGAGLMIAMGMPLAYAYAVAAPRTWQKAAAAIAGLLMIHAVMMTYSRGAMLSLALAAVWLLIHHRPRVHAAAIAVVLLVVVSVMAGEEIRERFLSTASYQQDDSAQSRLASWKAAWDIAWDAPLTGQGLRNANRFTYSYGADRYGRTIHSQYLQIAADSGFIAMLVYLAILTAAFHGLYKARQLCAAYLHKHGDDPPAGNAPHAWLNVSVRQIDAVTLGCQASLIAFAFGGLFLSLEVFELPWLLIALAGLWPGVLARHLDTLASSSAAQTQPAQSPASRKRPRRWAYRRRLSTASFDKGLAHP